MNTPTHAALNFLLLDRGSGAGRPWILLGAVLPDVPMFAFYLVEAFLFGQPAERIFREIYFRPHWQALFDAFHSIPLFLLAAAVFAWRGSRSGVLFASSLFVHSLVDWPTHLEDAHAYFWPLWREPLPGLVSYWHPGSPFRILEPLVIVLALGVFARRKLDSGYAAPIR